MEAGKYPVKVIQFGEGVFLRAFADWMIEKMNTVVSFNSSVAVVKPRPGRFSNAYARQNNRYTIVFKGIENGIPVIRKEENTVISRMIDPYTDFNEYLSMADNPDLICIISNTTESGIFFSDTDKASDSPALSFPGKLTQFLRRRYDTFKGSDNKGLIILPCELIENNGEELKSIVLRHADRWYNDAEFSKWLSESNKFPDTLVDRIVSGHSEDERRKLKDESGFDDELLVVAEPYHLLVIKSESLESTLPFRKAGLNVIWTDDISPFRTLKVRFLNGTHTFMAMCGIAMGLGNVLECMKNQSFKNALIAMNEEEVLPCILPFCKEASDYLKTVYSRFENPFLDHRLGSISVNSISKWKSRILPSIIDYYAMFSSMPDLLTFSLAALAVRYCTVPDINDVASGLDFFKELSPVIRENPAEVSRKIVSNTELCGNNISSINGIADKLAVHISDIFSLGIERALIKTTEQVIERR